jgi:tellurite resistance protein TerC
MNVPIWAWAAFLGVVLLMLAIDLLAHRKEHVISAREAAMWSVIWISLGLAFAAIIFWGYGAEYAGQYLAGFLIEKSLAVDNVFVFAVIFTYFAVPRELQHRVLFFGVLGALVFRAIFIALGAVLLKEFHWVIYIFGAFLLYTAWKMATAKGHEVHPEKNKLVQWLGRILPTTTEYHGQKFLIRRDGVLLATPLLAVLLVIETSDIIFAVDSIPAIFAVTQEPFLVFTSNAMAILGLRALYFLLADMMARFIYLQKGLAVVLAIVGVKMLLIDIYKVPTWFSLSLVAVVIGASVALSMRATRGSTTPSH